MIPLTASSWKEEYCPAWTVYTNLGETVARATTSDCERYSSSSYYFFFWLNGIEGRVKKKNLFVDGVAQNSEADLAQ